MIMIMISYICHIPDSVCVQGQHWSRRWPPRLPHPRVLMSSGGVITVSVSGGDWCVTGTTTVTTTATRETVMVSDFLFFFFLCYFFFCFLLWWWVMMRQYPLNLLSDLTFVSSAKYTTSTNLTKQPDNLYPLSDCDFIFLVCNSWSIHQYHLFAKTFVGFFPRFFFVRWCGDRHNCVSDLGHHPRHHHRPGRVQAQEDLPPACTEEPQQNTMSPCSVICAGRR